MRNRWVDQKQVKELAKHLVAKLFVPYGHAIQFLEHTKKSLKSKLSWTMDEDLFVGGVGVFDARDNTMLWTQVALLSLKKGDTLSVDFGKCHLSLPGGNEFKVGDII